MDSDQTHSADFHAVDRRMDQFDAKIDKVDAKIDASSERTKAGLELLTARIEERSKTQEMRWDMDHRQNEQAIALLTSTAADMRQQQSATDTRVIALEESRAVMTTTLAAAKRAGWLVATTVAGLVLYLVQSGLAHHTHP